ncbi:MAG: hypothetical protein EBU90_00740 [Proteobacteria bacterium]|nr:hypothetical protein [Pseudomonadota bacterium]NBP12959.1 hypothetical protein [bacterium]
MPTPIKNTENSQSSVNAIQGRTSGIQFVDNTIKDPNGSQTPDDKSYSIWQNAWTTLVKIFRGNIFLKGHGNISINAGQEVHVTAHNKQETTTGGSAFYNKGERSQINGEISEDEKKKIQEYHDHLDSITKKSQEAIKNTKAEKVVCPNCAQKHLADDKSDNWSIILDSIRKVTDNVPYLKGPFGVLRWLVTKVYVPLLGSFSNLSLNNGKGCGPGCEAGLKDGMSQKLQAGEAAVKAEMDKLSEKMNKLTASMNSNSSGAIIHAHGEHHIYGNPTGSPKTSPYITPGAHHSLPMNLRVSDALRNKLRVTTEGNCKVVVYQPPLSSPFGNLMMNIQNNLKITTGNAGMDLLSTGEIAIKGGSVHINGSEGEVSLTSKNLTTIGGGNVLIAADNKSGDTGVSIDSKHTFVRGAFNVNGDTAMLGGLTVDGALSVNYINCPSMAAPSTMNGPDDFVNHHANWLGTGLGLNAANLALKQLNYALQPSLLMTPVGITDLFMEGYNLAMMAVSIEIIPTGIFLGVSAGFGAGVCSGLVWNYTHNHTQPPYDHTHETPVPNGGYWKKAAGAGQARVAGSPAPTPAPTSGTFPRPGPRTWGGGCGGGGLYSKVRNLKYNINSDDAFNGGNYVTTTVVRNGDGSITPSPDLTYRYVKDTGTGVKIDPNTGTATYPLTGINC